MADSEIDSFIQKFKLLRNAGMEASLNFETKLGEVWISLNCKVGRNIPPPPRKPSIDATKKPYRSPSYRRRQVRRKAEREARNQNVIAEEAMDDEIAEENEIQADDLLDEVDGAATDDIVSDEDITDEAELSDGETETEDVLNEDLSG